MIVWLEKAAEQGNANAQTNLAILFEEGRGVAQNLEVAAEWYEKAARSVPPNTTALTKLGLMYSSGRGVGQNYTRAAELYSVAHAIGDPHDIHVMMAQWNLAVLYTNGQGVPRSDEAATVIYKEMAKAGQPGTNFLLAQRYHDGIGTKQR